MPRDLEFEELVHVPSAGDPDRLAALAALGLGADASPQEILSAYRRLARTSHPDTAPGDRADSEFGRINAAYRYLTTTSRHLAREASTGDEPVDPIADRAYAATDWDAQYRWPDQPQVVAGPVIIRPLPPGSR